MDMKEKMMYRAFPMGAVKLGDDYMKNAFSLEVAYLLELDADRLLAGFRETAGLDMRGARRYDGWENMLIGGHTLGHYLTAVAQACASADISENDRAALEEKLSYICRSLREC
ncbi:MAG TPA: glycoside hydrolase family 127 protein, partial [Bacillota bacterium]|nr:glycoside hydrolase family 127 protein [Bacillota bacterium]